MWPMSSLYLGYETKTIPHCSNMLKNHLRGREMDAELSHQRKHHFSSTFHACLSFPPLEI